MKKPSLLIIFLTVFIDLVGFGIVLPLLPIYSKNFGASGFMIGLIMASYSLMQFLFALGSALVGQAALLALLGSRLVAGICGANITVAQAYIADVTPPDQRSK